MLESTSNSSFSDISGATQPVQAIVSKLQRKFLIKTTHSGVSVLHDSGNSNWGS